MKGMFLVQEAGRGLMALDDSTKRIFKKHKVGSVVECEIKEFRNYKFHKKWFSMVKFAYDHWDAEQKSFNTFRAEIIILSGHYEVVASLGSNTVKKVPKSISFGSMSEEDFEELYSNTLDALLRAVPTLAKDREELIAMERELLNYG